MTGENQARLSGVVSKIYPPVTTPAGVSVARILLEHTSDQVEAGIKRQVKCKVFCVYVGGEITESQKNHMVTVSGFLSVNAHKELVLHITNLEKFGLKE